MQSELPLFESPEDALRALVQHLGGVKKVGARLFPDKSVDAAGRYLMDCVNSERSEKLSLSQILLLLRLAHAAGYHAAFAWLAAEVGYEAKPVTRAEEADHLAIVIEQSTRTLAAALAALEWLRK